MSQDVLTQLMAFIYSIAHYLGVAVVALIQKILPMAKALGALVDPIGYLAILSIFVVITTTVKKVAVIILVVGWVLIAIRVVLMALGV
jgi:hypothetical protein